MASKKSPAKPNRNNRGRPPVYRPDYPKRVRHLALIGLCDAEIATALGVTRQVFHRWKTNEHPELSDVLTDARQASGAVAAALYRRAIGFTKKTEKLFMWNGEVIRAETITYFPPDVTACLQILKRAYPEVWGDAGRGSVPPKSPTGNAPAGAGLTLVIDAATLAMCGVNPAATPESVPSGE